MVGLPDPAVVDRLASEPALAPALAPELVELLLDPPRADQVAGDCPRLPPELEVLCDEGARVTAEQALDERLATLLGDEDPVVAMWATELACRLGARGVGIARQVDPSAGTPPVEARRLRILAWSLPREAAVAELTDALAGPPAQALPAALELARLGAAPPQLLSLPDRLAPADALLARYAVQVAEGSVYRDVPTGL
ncbi:MAG: hypothetical protein H6739_22930 [Alphaproteobacteria bacterium]|nr:hypothetical protein [Alphaproteobacteria bacterium]